MEEIIGLSLVAEQLNEKKISASMKSISLDIEQTVSEIIQKVGSHLKEVIKTTVSSLSKSLEELRSNLSNIHFQPLENRPIGIETSNQLAEAKSPVASISSDASNIEMVESHQKLLEKNVNLTTKKFKGTKEKLINTKDSAFKGFTLLGKGVGHVDQTLGHYTEGKKNVQAVGQIGADTISGVRTAFSSGEYEELFSTISSGYQQIKSEATGFVANLGGMFTGLRSGYQSARDGINELKGAWNGAKETYGSFKDVIKNGSDVLKGVGDIVKGTSIVQGIWNGFLSLSNIKLSVITATTWAWNAALLGNPMTWLVLAIVAALVLLYVFWDEIVQFISDGLTWISELWQSFKDAILNMCPALMSFLDIFGFIWKKAREKMEEFISWVKKEYPNIASFLGLTDEEQKIVVSTEEKEKGKIGVSEVPLETQKNIIADGTKQIVSEKPLASNEKSNQLMQEENSTKDMNLSKPIIGTAFGTTIDQVHVGEVHPPPVDERPIHMNVYLDGEQITASVIRRINFQALREGVIS